VVSITIFGLSPAMAAEAITKTTIIQMNVDFIGPPHRFQIHPELIKKI
jgi:hypothetical protein